jgi:hypothetical protein
MGAVFVGDDPHADEFLQAASRQAELASVRNLLGQREHSAVVPPAQMAQADRRAA